MADFKTNVKKLSLPELCDLYGVLNNERAINEVDIKKVKKKIKAVENEIESFNKKTRHV